MIKHITKKDLPTCVNGEIYMYKSHPHKSRCELANNKINILCTVCNKNITNNWCECSLNKKLLHEDRVMMRNVIKSHTHTRETHEKFLNAKGCTIDHFRSIFNEKDLKHGKGEGTWSFDHIISPVNNFDLNNKKHRSFIFHFKNIQKMIHPFNQQKGCKVIKSEIDYVLSVINTIEADKIHDELIIMRNKEKSVELQNNSLPNKELLNTKLEQNSEKNINTSKQLLANSVSIDKDREYSSRNQKVTISSDLWKINTIINKLIIDREKEQNKLNSITKRIDSINDLIKLEIEKSCKEIKKENNEIDKKMNVLQFKKMKNEESLSLLYNYLN